ncbi:D-2-hydroxyacid dehydrogenase [Arthrobacter gandavensis]|uniref:D-2-hydroxyacid dehydrogenase n=1 Tax=Arthrobacter gandavensis TaxID=169960 RepID=UPI00188E7A57|nr:D-2-hydroxyacid dehydrogenase [Arthrobacter gandavensis]MBF4993253.1 D-2-hydroxyacid dehydrogenase [Arthrobacter gandavensis]
MAKPVLTILTGNRDVTGLENLRALADVRLAADADELAAALPGTEIVYLWNYFADGLRAGWDRADALQWVHLPAAGVDRLLFPELAASNVTVTNARGIFDAAMAEYALAGILYFAKNVPAARLNQAERRWQHFGTSNLAGTRALVAGTGSIGRTTARLLRAVGIETDGLGRTARDGDADFGAVHASADFAAAAGNYDWIVLVAPLTDDTRGMLDAEVLGAMRSSAVLVNMGRGELVVQCALEGMLRDGRIRGAVLDVTSPEPLPKSSPLWGLENVLITPHLSGDSRSHLPAMAAQFEANLRAYLEGKPLENVVDKQLGFVAAPVSR